MPKPKLDPELVRQIEAARNSDVPVQAVLTLRTGNVSGETRDSEKVKSTVLALLRRVAQRVGVHPNDVNVFGNLASFAISAKAEFVQELLDQPEIASAMANRRVGG